MMNTSVAKSFAFPARNRLDVAEREAHHARNAELEAALTEGLARGFAEGLARGREAAQAEARDLLESSAREGLARGHGAGVAEMNRAADALRGALDGFNLERAQFAAEAEAFCVDLALAIVARMIEADKARAEFARRATQAALQALAPEPATAVFLSPADLNSVGKAMSGLPLQEDATLKPGTSRVEAGRLLVESSLQEAFAQVRAAVIETKTKRTSKSEGKPESVLAEKRDAF
jgi:flagellar biosynthesis/type III secretory pathway protein FliH